VMIVFYLMLTGLCLVNNWIRLRNLNGQPPQAALLLIPGFSHECESEA